MITCMCDDLFVPDLMHISFFVCRPIAKRTKAELESDVKSTGMLMEVVVCLPTSRAVRGL